jgi:hypothetical protein
VVVRHTPDMLLADLHAHPYRLRRLRRRSDA